MAAKKVSTSKKPATKKTTAKKPARNRSRRTPKKNVAAYHSRLSVEEYEAMTKKGGALAKKPGAKEIDPIVLDDMPIDIHPCPPDNSYKFTSDKKIHFVEIVSQTGQISLSAKVCGVSIVTISSHRKKDKDFDNAVRYALELFSVRQMEMAEKELYTRAVEGDEKELTYRGYKTGQKIKEKSDILLMFMLKAMNPDKYRENTKVEQTNNVNVVVDKLSDAELTNIIARSSNAKGRAAIEGTVIK